MWADLFAKHLDVDGQRLGLRSAQVSRQFVVSRCLVAAILPVTPSPCYREDGMGRGTLATRRETLQLVIPRRIAMSVAELRSAILAIAQAWRARDASNGGSENAWLWRALAEGLDSVPQEPWAISGEATEARIIDRLLWFADTWDEHARGAAQRNQAPDSGLRRIEPTILREAASDLRSLCLRSHACPAVLK